jgi:hypothetical protein
MDVARDSSRSSFSVSLSDRDPAQPEVLVLKHKQEVLVLKHKQEVLVLKHKQNRRAVDASDGPGADVA